ncbi:MAG: hypothetical protein ABIO14_09310 [Aeromicrobium sp.]
MGTAGKRLWKSVADEYELEEHESCLLVQAVRTVDALEKLDAQVRRDGPVVSGPQGERAHPALVEARQQRIALARLFAVLRLPSGDEGDLKPGSRPQRRSGVRGTYGIQGLVG